METASQQFIYKQSKKPGTGGGALRNTGSVKVLQNNNAYQDVDD
jgi:hypothetical protein